jgi:hypothetical protein
MYQGPLLCFSGVFTVEEVDGEGDKVSGDTTTVDLRTFLEAVWNMSLQFACFVDEAFFSPPWQKQNFQLWDHYPQELDFQDF